MQFVISYQFYKLYPKGSSEQIVTIGTQTNLFMFSDNNFFPIRLSSHRYVDTYTVNAF